MKAAILSVGTELLFGQITNSNTVFLSQQLNLLGFDVYYHFTVGDNPARLGEMIKSIFKECDLILTTGGLGPTEDDLTKETIAQVMDDKLVEDKKSLDNIVERGKKWGKTITKNNFKQALVPSKAKVFFNHAGSAPGFALKKDNKMIIAMPGPPKEMTTMWEREIKPFLIEESNAVIHYKMLRFFGIGESLLETKLLDLIHGQKDPTIATYAGDCECKVRVASKRPTLEEAEAAVDDMVVKVKERVGEFLFSDNNESLAEVVGRKLIDNNISISCCESCTGGKFASALTDIPGISKVFDRGLVTYTEKAKIEELGVKEETLEKFTAVSSQTAIEMARGLKEKTGSRIAISVTGYAGPEGDYGRPAGNIFICCIFDDKEEVKELNTGRSDRDRNRNYSVAAMLDMVNRMIDTK